MAIFALVYALVAIVFIVGVRLATPEPVPLSRRLTPNVALAGAALFPLLFGGAMVIIWRMLDEIAHRMVLRHGRLHSSSRPSRLSAGAFSGKAGGCRNPTRWPCSWVASSL
jgi:hypothetical protein